MIRIDVLRIRNLHLLPTAHVLLHRCSDFPDQYLPTIERLSDATSWSRFHSGLGRKMSSLEIYQPCGGTMRTTRAKTLRNAHLSADGSIICVSAGKNCRLSAATSWRRFHNGGGRPPAASQQCANGPLQRPSECDRAVLVRAAVKRTVTQTVTRTVRVTETLP